MTGIPYIAPFALFDLDAEHFSEEQWKACRKTILAEFELTGQTEIAWKDHSFDKSRLLQLLDEVREPETRAFHEAVLRDQLLFRLLTAYDPAALDDGTATHDPHLVKQCLPYLVYACGHAVCNAFRAGNRNVLLRIYQPHPLLPGPVLQHIWNPLEVYLLRAGEELQQFPAKPVSPETVKSWYEKYMLPADHACLALLPKHMEQAVEVYINGLLRTIWLMPHSPKQAARLRKMVLDMHELVNSRSTRTLLEILQLYNRLNAAELIPVRRSRRLLVAAFMPVLLILITSIVFLGNGGDADQLSPVLLRVVSSGALLSAMVTIGFIAAAFRYTWRNRETISGWWYLGLLLLNLLVFPLFWLFFIRHPKDRSGNVLSIVLLVVTIVLVFIWGSMRS